MSLPRMYATATLLANGKVLIAGGSTHVTDNGRDVLASAELYDPATHTFTPTGSMTTARSGATASLLRDGRVLIAGGLGCRTTKACSPHDISGAGGGPLTSAELYDPTTGKFSRTGSMFTATADSSTLLPDGRVLMANGDGSQKIELYDPTIGKFTRAGSLRGFYVSANAILLPSGRVLFVGPSVNGPTAELFDPASGKSTPISVELFPGFLAAAQSDSYYDADETATALKDGRVLLCVFDYLVT